MPFPYECDLSPLEGAGPVRFGMSYDDAVGVLGEPDQPMSRLWRSNAWRAGWYDGALAVHFNPDVVFIEFSRDAGFMVKLIGLDVFRTSAEEVVHALVRNGHAFQASSASSAKGQASAHRYVFKDLQVALWRQVVPKGEFDEEGKHFDTVAVAQRAYLV